MYLWCNISIFWLQSVIVLLICIVEYIYGYLKSSIIDAVYFPVCAPVEDRSLHLVQVFLPVDLCKYVHLGGDCSRL